MPGNGIMGHYKQRASMIYLSSWTYTVNIGNSAFIILTLMIMIATRKPTSMITLRRNLLIHGGVIPFLIDTINSNDDLRVFYEI